MRALWRGIRRVSAGWGAFFLGLALAVPAGAGGWDQAYGNLSNTSFVNAATNVPVVANWAYQLDGEVGTGGPAVDPVSGTIYVGTGGGTLWAFRPDGNVHCKRLFKETTLSSVPALFPNGDVAVLVTRAVDATHDQTSLARVAPNCDLVWEVDLPTMFRNPSASSGSPKIWTLDGQSFLFVHVRFSNWDLSLPPYSFHELIVFDEAGQVFARHPVGEQCINLHGGGWLTHKQGGRKGSGDLVPTASGPPLFETYGWPTESTPAILDTPLHGFATPRAPMVALTDHHCRSRLEILQFDPAAATVPGRLVKRWGDRAEADGVKLSSPAVTPEGLVVFGASCHRVRIYDLVGLTLKATYDAGEPVMHPPALAPDAWIVNSDHAVHFLKPGTKGLLPTARPQPYPTAGSAAGLAASANEVVVPNLDELGIFEHTLQSLAHALTQQEFHTAKPALTAEGRLYAVSQTNEKSILFAFGPP